MMQQKQQESREPHRSNSCDDPAPIPDGYADLRRGLAWGDLGRRLVLTVRGPDAVRFVDNFTTAALSALAEGEGTEGFFTDARGWVLAMTSILRIEDGVWLDAPAGLAASLREHLDHYHIRERLELCDASEDRGNLIIAGPQAEAWLAARLSVRPPEALLHHGRGLLGDVPVAIVRVDWYGPTGFLVQSDKADHPRLVAWLEAHAVPRAEEAAWDAARVVAVPLQESAAVQPFDPPQEEGELLLETRRFRVVRVSEPCTDGSRREREVVRHPGSVVIVPLVSPQEVCLVEVVRVAVGRTLLELPAGTLDRVESLEEAARRELAEETGYRAGRIVPAGEMWMSPGILRERMHLFVAEDLVAGPQALEPGEQIRTRVVTWDEAIAMCLDGRIDDAKTIAGLLLTAARRR